VYSADVQTRPLHRSRVIGSPWEGIYCTHIDSARHYGRHWHATYGLGLLDDGAQSSASGRGSVDAYAGDLIATNPGEVHDGRPLGVPSRRWRIVYFDPGALACVAGDCASGVEIAQPVIRDLRLSQALQRLLGRLEDWNRGRGTCTDRLACEEALVETFGLLLDRHTNTAPMREAGANVARVRNRLADDVLNPPSLGDMAAMAGLSKYQLLRRFEKAYGVTPHAWLLQQRAERARGLIQGGAALALAAVASGFADQSHMTRIFVRQFGFTPGAWKKAAGQSPQ
jgi:AraC-like DNA-binding protein